MSRPASRYEILLVGGGAIGSRFAATDTAAVPDVALTCIDRDRVRPENLGIAAFAAADVDQPKALVLAARRRAQHRIGRGLYGDVRYALRPGLVRGLAAAVFALDNPTALRDATEAVWAAGATAIPVLVLTCGGEAGGYQVRVCVSPGVCPVCLFGELDRFLDRAAQGTSCVDTSAPRAAAVAATAAAAAAARILAGWRAGDLTLANCRLQLDPGGEAEYRIQMPAAPAPGCPVPHGNPSHGDQLDAAVHSVAAAVCELGGSINAVTVGALAEAAIRTAGADAELMLGRRAVPLAGLYCPQCGAVAPSSPLLIPAACAAWRGCTCGGVPRALGTRHVIAARDLLTATLAPATLAAWGAGHGDEFLVQGSRGRVRLRCAFEWEDLDANGNPDPPPRRE